MEQQSSQTIIVREAIKALLILGLMTGTTLAVLASETVTVKGKILLHDSSIENVEVEVLSDKGVSWCSLSPSGHFKVKLPAGGEALIRFKKDGYITKEIKINTKNVFASRQARKENRALHFDVELMNENHGKELAFRHPVGQISFLNGSGLMRISYLYRLVEVKRSMHDGREVNP